MYDLRNLIHVVERTVASHNLGRAGAYRRWGSPGSRLAGAPELGINPYGVADSANLLYTINHFPGDPALRQEWIDTLQALQDPESGLFEEPTHHPIHTTAHCIAALELFDARPRYRLRELHDLLRPHELSAFLDSLDWRNNPWMESHRGAGLYAALVLAGEVNLEWEERYFTWLWEEADPQTGLFRKGRASRAVDDPHNPIFPHLAGTFHYLFNLVYARRPLRYPENLVDTCLEIYQRRAYPLLGEKVGFAEIDWVFCLNRAARQSGHRCAEAWEALSGFAQTYVRFLLSLDPETDEDFNDLHRLFGALCCLAELQQALPGQLRTQRPLRLVLDRRPFI
jgi:hypothetical protein